MPTANRLPSISLVTYFKCEKGQLTHELARAIRDHAEKYPEGELSDAHFALNAWSRLLVDVPNGGFAQYFFNAHGAAAVAPLCDLLNSLELRKVSALLNEAVAIYTEYEDRFRVQNPFEGLFGSIAEFDKLDRAFPNVGIAKADAAIEKWARDHIQELLVGDDANPIESGFTGTAKAYHPNGALAETLEVKKGKASGPYKEFFDDGSVRQITFYKGGQVSGDYWPDGQLKKKESRRGNQTVIEWYYPSGKIQKRIVLEKSGYHAEPARLFHENGQLAEELCMQADKKHGRWLKFFEDGSPQLEAEHVQDQHLPIVHNAWTADRQQVVKNGTGVYEFDGRSIHASYTLFFESQWRMVSELRDGIQHGKSTTYNNFDLWRVASFARGKQHGDSTSYWDNGRVRHIERYEEGEVVAKQSFPKFTQPLPAVELTVEANERLYTAWRHIPVDIYPVAENLEEIRSQLKIPQFLLDIHQRNIAGQLKSNYEDCNTFNDGIAYFLQVDTAGRVVVAQPNGSGIASGGDWNTYLPLLKQLRFKPGYIRDRAVVCKVLARVDHTFVEGSAPVG